MRTLFLSLGLAIALFSSSCKTAAALLLQPSTLETVMAVKEVLNSSSFRAIKVLNQLASDDPTSALPKEVGLVLGSLRTLGFGDKIDHTTQAIGSASKIVASESTGIMKDAISEVSIKDAASIVVGGENAATSVLRQAMYGSVKKRYSDRLDTELGKTEAKKYWPIAATAYNLFAKEKVDGKLSDFLAERAVDGLFLTMGKEEKEIRRDYKKLGSDVVTKVWDYYSKK